MSSVFLSSYRNTLESLGELEKAVKKTRLRFMFPQHFSLSQTTTRVSIYQLDCEPEGEQSNCFSIYLP